MEKDNVSKIYVGILPSGNREVFKSAVVPTNETHGKNYNAVIGPFKTFRGADFSQKYGGNNPHCRCVNDAERLAKKECESIKQEGLRIQGGIEFNG